MRARLVFAAAISLAIGGQARAEEPVSWAGLPIFNYNSDEGFGMGGLASLYWQRPGVAPYARMLRLQIFVTTKVVQAHELRWDWLRLAGTRLRWSGRAGYFSTRVRTYCGLGNRVSCDAAKAEEAAEARGLPAGSEALDDFVRHYYLRRFVDFWATTNARYPITGRLWAFSGLRASYYVPDPYEGSLYQQAYPDGERGLASALHAGLVFDTRDNEPAPRCGVWLEASLRAASPILGSSWTYGGANATARLYRPLGDRLVAATRLAADVLVGDPPVEELGYMGGTQWYSAFGGLDAGRGVRLHRYLGRVKLIAQQEIRWSAWRGRRLALGLAGFVDAGWIGLALDEVGGDPDRVLWSAGGGLRATWKGNFVVRADVGFSPDEQDDPAYYLDLGHTY